MPDLEALRRLTCEMYLHTRNGQDALVRANAARSATAVRRAKVRKLAEGEQQRALGRIRAEIAERLLNEPMDSETLAERLREWNGARVREVQHERSAT